MSDFRYTCEQHAGMDGYGWDRYDPRTGGVQTIHDNDNDIDITTSFVKITEPSIAGAKGGNWAARIRGTPRSGAQSNLRTTVVFTIASPEAGSLGGLTVDASEADMKDGKGLSGNVTLSGESKTMGDYTIVVTHGKGERPLHSHPSNQDRPLDRTFVSSSSYPTPNLWQAKRTFGCNRKYSTNDIANALS